MIALRSIMPSHRPAEPPSLADRIEATVVMMRATVIANGWRLSGDERVTPKAAAALVGMTPESFANIRSEQKGPPHYNIGMAGSRISFRLRDLAGWIERRRAI